MRHWLEFWSQHVYWFDEGLHLHSACRVLLPYSEWKLLNVQLNNGVQITLKIQFKIYLINFRVRDKLHGIFYAKKRRVSENLTQQYFSFTLRNAIKSWGVKLHSKKRSKKFMFQPIINRQPINAAVMQVYFKEHSKRCRCFRFTSTNAVIDADVPD